MTNILFKLNKCTKDRVIVMATYQYTIQTSCRGACEFFCDTDLREDNFGLKAATTV